MNRIPCTRRRRGDAGSITLFYIGSALCLLIILGFVYDAGGALNAAARADAIAQEAARAGGQQIDAAQAIEGTAIVVDPPAAVAAAQAYLSDAGVSGTVSVSSDGTSLEVTVTSSHNVVMTSLIGFSTITVTGTGSAQLIHQTGG
ncbi:pilus assembly protein TadG-related protein [Streptomyces xiamenensis]|uniref:pilus assembly protein TadG-related protein n=1 Tax=Streptomyces xiamenensis TaxID=408015 RepID=UPI0035E17160